jgi:hypothetical protein
MPLFRLIDSQERAIRDFHNFHLSQLTYAALSCVWGGGHRTTLETANYAVFQTPGSLAAGEGEGGAAFPVGVPGYEIRAGPVLGAASAGLEEADMPVHAGRG